MFEQRWLSGLEPHGQSATIVAGNWTKLVGLTLIRSV